MYREETNFGVFFHSTCDSTVFGSASPVAGQLDGVGDQFYPHYVHLVEERLFIFAFLFEGIEIGQYDSTVMQVLESGYTQISTIALRFNGEKGLSQVRSSD